MIKVTLSLLLLSWTLSAAAHDGTINIDGSIEEPGCTVSSDSVNQTISLGDIASSQLSQPGETSQPIMFKISFEDCTSVTKTLSLRFNGTSDSTNPDLVAIDSDPGAASGIAIAIKDSTSSLLPINTNTVAYSLPYSYGSLTYYAQYMVTKDSVTAGTANATVTFSMTYE